MIHPRRLKGTAANIARYYTIGDYYTCLLYTSRCV